jgi:CO/xanthine dehydrogenase Mo-binding subunit
MDKLAVAIGMDPLEFRMLNAYRDGDMKAHRREAKNCALIECARVAAEKANWPLRDEFRRMSSRTGGAATHAGAVRSVTPTPAAAAARSAAPQRVPYDRDIATGPAHTAPPPTPPRSTPPPPPSPPAGSTHGAPRFSSVFGTRRR